MGRVPIAGGWVVVGGSGVAVGVSGVDDAGVMAGAGVSGAGAAAPHEAAAQGRANMDANSIVFILSLVLLHCLLCSETRERRCFVSRPTDASWAAQPFYSARLSRPGCARSSELSATRKSWLRRGRAP